MNMWTNLCTNGKTKDLFDHSGEYRSGWGGGGAEGPITRETKKKNILPYWVL